MITLSDLLKLYNVETKRIIDNAYQNAIDILNAHIDKLHAVAKVLLEKEKIKESSEILTDLGADSLDVVDILHVIEEEFEIKVPDSEIENLKTDIKLLYNKKDVVQSENNLQKHKKEIT